MMYASWIIICEKQDIFSALLLLPEPGVARGFSSHFSIINFGLMVNKCMKKVTTSESFIQERKDFKHMICESFVIFIVYKQSIWATLEKCHDKLFVALLDPILHSCTVSQAWGIDHVSTPDLASRLYYTLMRGVDVLEGGWVRGAAGHIINTGCYHTEALWHSWGIIAPLWSPHIP